CGDSSWKAVDLKLAPVPFDLTAAFRLGPDGISIAFDADAALFDPFAIETMLTQYRRLLAAALIAPDQPCSQLSPWSGDEITFAEISDPKSKPFVPVHVAFERAAIRTPDALAIIAGEQWE